MGPARMNSKTRRRRAGLPHCCAVAATFAGLADCAAHRLAKLLRADHLAKTLRIDSTTSAAPIRIGAPVDGRGYRHLRRSNDRTIERSNTQTLVAARQRRFRRHDRRPPVEP